jgi:uncharacterized membrane protein YraQ (UPF0718 family)
MVDAFTAVFGEWVGSVWSMLLDSGVFFLFGLVLAGLIWLLMNQENVGRFVRDEGMTGVLKAALIGIPLPLCSCSVLPVASQLHRSGAGRGATVSFLISTPESGVDSILVTYSLTDPLLTIARPVTAFLTAMAAGFAETLSSGRNNRPPQMAGNGLSKCENDLSRNAAAERSLPFRVWMGLVYSFTDLLKDLSPHLFLGFALAGIVDLLLGDNMAHLPEAVKSGWVGYIGAILLGLPLYICATASTPLAAVLLLSGFSPGAVLVFLMVGPATNMASVTVLRKILGSWSTLRYLSIIVAVSVVCGVVLDRLYGLFAITAVYRTEDAASHGSWLHVACAAVLSGLILIYTAQWVLRRLRSFQLKRD